MSSTKTTVACLLLLAVFTSTTFACGKKSDQDSETNKNATAKEASDRESSSDISVNACCVCGQPIDVTFIVRNELVEPFFEFQTVVKGQPQRELLRALENAAVADKRFRFHAQHYGSMGYMITSLNELAASAEKRTYWSITSKINKDGLPTGVSSYIPIDQEVVIFTYTSY